MEAETSKLYCRFHPDQELQLGGKDLDRSKYEMVLCPYEPQNYVLKIKLEDHLKTCPKRLELELISKKE